MGEGGNGRLAEPSQPKGVSMSRTTPKGTKSSLPPRSGDSDLVHDRRHAWERKYERVELVRGVAL
jgi:hypothetical protein